MTGENFKRIERKNLIRELKEKLWAIEERIAEYYKKYEEENYRNEKYIERLEYQAFLIDEKIWYLNQLT